MIATPKRPESRLDLIEAALDQLDGPGILTIHRNVPGEHHDVSACWCVPHEIHVDGWETAAQVEAEIRSAEVMH